MSDLSVCVLCYGDYPQLARRCLNSLLSAEDGWEHIQDFRIGLNNVSDETAAFVREWGRRAVAEVGVPCYLYNTYENRLKYPTMRRMIFDAEFPLADFTMWFDDDSYLAGGPDFWNDVVATMCDADMLGQRWFKKFIGKQRDWIMAQPWAQGAPPPGPDAIFSTGGWWTIRSSILAKYDWPFPEIRHKGGDMVLGELCRCQGLRVLQFDRGVCINANANGEHSKADRRGLSLDDQGEFEIGFDYSGEPLGREHQALVCFREVINGPVS